jgi:mediator of RNA polymerase II transcription subunit 7
MEEQQQPGLASAFPNPPPFWHHFTPENLKRVSELRTEAGSKKHDPSKELPVRLLDLPAELRYLQPPEPLTTGIYRVFGDFFDVRIPFPCLRMWDCCW